MKQTEADKSSSLELADLDLVRNELEVERRKSISSMSQLIVEREQHNATRLQLENAKLPFWKKLGIWI